MHINTSVLTPFSVWHVLAGDSPVGHVTAASAARRISPGDSPASRWSLSHPVLSRQCTQLLGIQTTILCILILVVLCLGAAVCA